MAPVQKQVVKGINKALGSIQDKESLIFIKKEQKVYADYVTQKYLPNRLIIWDLQGLKLKLSDKKSSIKDR